MKKIVVRVREGDLPEISKFSEEISYPFYVDKLMLITRADL